MDPLTALIIAMWIAGRLTKNVYQDAVFKARGEDPPSFRREMARWEAKQARQARSAGRSADTPGRRFFANAWADAVASADERRARVTEKAKDRRRAKWADADAAAAEDEAYAINKRVADEPSDEGMSVVVTRRCERCGKPTPPGDIRGRIPLRLEIVQRVCPDCSAAIDRDDREFQNLDPDWGRIDDSEPTSPDHSERMVQCASCGGDVRPVDTSWVNVDGATLAMCPMCRLTRAEQPEPELPEPPSCPPNAYDDGTQPPVPEPVPPAGEDAEVIQFADWQTKSSAGHETKESHMSEITGLRSAIAFAEGSATSADQAITQTEMAIANLQAGGTSGAAITELQQAMENLRATAAQFRAAASTLSAHLGVTEQYEANQGAGSREFVTSE